jgi:predicted nucleic acid-binding Zn ribbon protein
MLFHVKLEFDLDTETRQTTNVTPQVVTRAEAHRCGYTKCGKPIPLDQMYCDQTCFRAHGKRPRRSQKPVYLPPQEIQAVEPLTLQALPLRRDSAASAYQSFTFPQLT